MEAVTELYRCLLDDTIALTRSLGASLGNIEVAIMCPAADVEELTRLTRGVVGVVPQKGEGLAAGLTSVFAHFAASGEQRVVAFNSDSPHLPASVLCSAFEALNGHDVVVGPTHDGGYYLVGAKAAHPVLFDGDGMGTQSALEALLARARGLQLSVGFTEPFYDIDVESDLTRLTAELLLDPAKAPRTAAWLKQWEQAIQVRTGSGRPVKLTPSSKVYVLGVVMLVALTMCSRKFGSMGGPSFLIALGVAGIAYLLAIREFDSTPRFPRRVIVIGLMLAALWHLPFLLAPPGSDDDIHRYLWDGRVQRLGYNPYIVVPGDPALAALHTPETRTLNHPDLPSPYPAGAELFFRAITAIHESVFTLKVAFVVCDFAIILVLLDVSRRSGQAAHWVLAYAWNPLLATEVAGSGHVDIVGVLLLLVSLAALGRRWRAVAAVAFGLAVAVKLLPIVLLPLYWKRVRIRDGALAAVVAGLLYVPFFNHGQIPLGSLGTYAHSFRFNDPLFATLERVAAPELVVGLAVVVGFLTAVWLRSKAPEWSPDAFAWPMAASLLCAPVVYPWYLVWLLPFARSASTLPIIIWTVSIIPTYYVWHLRALGRPWIVPGWIMLLEYGSVALAGAIIGFRRFKRPAASLRSTD